MLPLSTFPTFYRIILQLELFTKFRLLGFVILYLFTLAANASGGIAFSRQSHRHKKGASVNVTLYKFHVIIRGLQTLDNMHFTIPMVRKKRNYF